MKNFLLLGFIIWIACQACEAASAQQAAVNAVDKFPDQGLWTLTNSDFLRVPVFVGKLTTHADPTSRFIWEALATNTRVVLDDYQSSRGGYVGAGGLQQDASALEALLPVLNSLISGPLIYKEGRFSSNSLAENTLQMLARRPTGDARAHLNRMLLEDTYPELLAKSTRIVSDAADGRFAVVDFRKQFITFYTNEGKKISESDVATALKSASRNRISHWDPSRNLIQFGFRGSKEAYMQVGAEGTTIDIQTGAVADRGRD